MQLVINIDEKKYKWLKEHIPKADKNSIVGAVVHGTPLPKGHGRLIDATRLRSMYSINRANFNTVVGIQKWIDDAPTILEADRSEEP